MVFESYRLIFVTVPHSENHLYKTFSVEISPAPKVIYITLFFF